MATLVLSTVGTALGGPIGGAIGSLVGQGIDRELFGPGPRKGPRLGDLAVQTSSYGTPIPRLYGTMRVAGTVVWATELQESSQLQSGGKGQPDVLAYSYSVSLAVALSSRAANGVRRIWADGKLLRGAAGDVKVRTDFRFHAGSEDQSIDPLIGSIEGIASTPAYRGLALAVFENLELAEFGNRIPFLTFEVEADGSPPAVGALLEDATAGAIECALETPIDGYAAHGASMRLAVQPLVDQLGVDLSDEGDTVRSPGALSAAVGDDELGCGAGSDAAPRTERSQKAAGALPAALTLGYYDAERDYQTGQMRAVASGSGPREDVDLPACMTAGFAKSVAQSSLARRWAHRDRLTVRLPPSFMHLQPGNLVQLPGNHGSWSVEKVTIEAMVVSAELRPLWRSAGAIAADPGRPLASPDTIAQPTVLALLDLPDLGVARHDVPVIHLAACTTSGSWRPVPLELSFGAEIRASQSAPGEAVIGIATTVLGNGQAALFDLSASVEVELADAEHWLESRDEEALANGANLAAIGSELIQFGVATPVGGRRFLLSKLLRGRRGTEWAMATHVAGETFVLIGAGSLKPIELPAEVLGSTIEARALAIGDGAGTVISAAATGEAMRPPSPVHLRAAMTGPGTIELGWVRRSRSGWAWLDEVDSPLGEAAEKYRVRVEGQSGAIDLETSVSHVSLDASSLAPVGSGAAIATVRQVGDRALSRPASISLTIE